MKLRVIRYNKAGDFHELEDENGKLFYIDLFISGSFENNPDNKADLTDKWIEVDEIYAYCYIGNGIRIISSADASSLHPIFEQALKPFIP